MTFLLQGFVFFSFSSSLGMFRATFHQIQNSNVLSLGWRCNYTIELSIVLVKKKHINTSNHYPQGTNISSKNGILKMIFLFPRWDMLIPYRVPRTQLLAIQCMHHCLLVIGRTLRDSQGECGLDGGRKKATFGMMVMKQLGRDVFKTRHLY